jgi:hypothetical protein
MTRYTSPDHQVSALLGIFGSPLPCVRVSMQLQHAEYTNEVYVGRKEDAVREIAEERSSSAFFHRRKLKRILENSREHRIDLRLETEPKAGTFALVTKRRLEDLELGLGRDVETPHSANSANGAE